MIRVMLLAAALGLASSCAKQAQTPLQEDLNGLRVIGAQVMPLVPQLIQAGGTAANFTLTVFATLPLGATLQLTPETASGRLQLDPTKIVVGAPSYSDHASFRLATVVLTVPVPDESTVRPANATGTTASATASGTATATTAGSGTTATANAASTAPITGSFNYSLAVSSSAGAETADGAVLTASVGHADLALANPTLQIEAPAPGASVSSGGTPLSMDYTDNNQENAVVSWYVSSGPVVSRSKKATTWTPGGSGAQTVISTVRAQRTNSFAIGVADVTAE